MHFLFPQISENKKEEFELDISVSESKEQQTKPDSRDVAVQNSPEYQERGVQTHGEATATEITGRPFALLLAEIPSSVPKWTKSAFSIPLAWKAVHCTVTRIV